MRCGGTPELRYEGQFASVICRDCANWFVRYVFPPGVVEGRSTDELLAALDRKCRTVRADAAAGVCPLCFGRIGVRLVPGSPDRFGHPVAVEYDCADCTCLLHSTVGAHVAEHPAVVAFLHDRGVDPREPSLWELPFAYDPGRLSGGDGRNEATLTVQRGDASLKLTLDRQARTVSLERTG